jgi:probable HAF family extracellular repeat protein
LQQHRFCTKTILRYFAAKLNTNALKPFLTVALEFYGGIMKLTALHWVLLIAFAFLISACDMDGTPPTPKITRLEITPGSVMFTKAGDTQIFSVKAYDQNNAVMTGTPISWISSNAATVSVSADGLATAVVDLGSAQLTAQVGDVKTITTVIIAQPVSGALLLEDARVMGEPQEVVAGQLSEIGTRYSIALTEGISPSIDSVLLGNGEKAVAGKVVSVTPNATGYSVILERLPVGELFDRLSVNLQGTLVNDNLNAASSPSQSVSQSQLSEPNSKRLGTTRTAFDLGPFTCQSDELINIINPSLKLDPKALLNFDFVLDYESFGVTRFRFKIDGEISVALSGGLSLGGALMVNLICNEKNPISIPVPVGGPLAALLGPMVQLGMEFRISGELKATALGVELEGKMIAKGTLGLEYTVQNGVKSLNTFESEKKFTPKIIKLDNPGIETKVEIATQPTFTLAFGNRFLGLPLMVVKTGPAITMTFKAPKFQILNTVEPASYALTIKNSLEPGKDVQAALEKVFSKEKVDYIKLNLLTITADIAVSSSPTPDGQNAITADHFSYQLGEKVKFNVTLDPANINFFPGVYNVKEVKIVRVGTNGELIDVISAQPTAGQTKFSLEWTATADGVINKNFFAFVQPEFLEFMAIKLGEVKSGCIPKANEKYCVTFLQFGAVDSYVAPIRFNDNGQIIGVYYPNSTRVAHSFFWDNGQVTDLGTQFKATDINNLGQVSGYRYPNGVIADAVIWQNGQFKSLGSSVAAYANAINDQGHVVGSAIFVETLPFQAWIWTGTVMNPLGAHLSFATDINNTGKVVGLFDDNKGRSEGFLWDNGNSVFLPHIQGNYVIPIAINNSDQILVKASKALSLHLLQNNAFTQIDSLSAYHIEGNALNNRGQIVGFAEHGTPQSGSIYSGFIWQNGVTSYLEDLIDPSLNIRISQAFDINNNGQIIAYCSAPPPSIASGCLLTPAQ